MKKSLLVKEIVDRIGEKDYVRLIQDQEHSLTASQRAAIGVKLLPLFEAEAKARQRAGGGNKRSRRPRRG